MFTCKRYISKQLERHKRLTVVSEGKMNKHLMVAGAAILLLSLSSVVETQSTESEKAVEEVTETQPVRAFEAGQFLMEDDFEHLSDALGYLNLTPEDMQFEKKHLDHSFRLPVVKAALDDPVGLPLVAEGAAKDFRGIEPATLRTLAAAKLLGLGDEAWSIEGLKKAEETYTKLIVEYHRLSREASIEERAGNEDVAALKYLKAKRVDRRIMKLNRDEVFGGKVTVHADASGNEARFSDRLNAYSTTYLKGVTGTLGQRSMKISEIEQLAAQMPSLFAGSEIAIPGVEYAQPEESILETAANMQLQYLFVAGLRLAMVLEYQAIRWSQKSLQKLETVNGVEGVTGDVVLALEGPNGWYVVGGHGPNTYSGDNFIGIIDLGGDDIYKGRVAAGIGLPGQSAFSFVLDLGGDDQYLGEDFTQGFGFNGVGILHDLGKGNDVYRSRHYSQGAGLCGYGELYDDGGDDIYTADSFTQGAGSFGYGQLLDRSGDDKYRACRYSQGFAQVMGVGVLTDSDGNDVYYAGGKYLHEPLSEDRYQSFSQGFATGNRSWSETGGGVALLLDEGNGNDTYTADTFGQGGGYWYSLGMLVDKGGNDAYTLGQYGQGAGVHLSSGILVDIKGDDVYTNSYGVSIGGADDRSVGWLIDRAGDDTYTGNGIGQGLNFSTGILLDVAGNDTYMSAQEGNIGVGKNNSISLLLDLDGTDTYGPKELSDNTVTQRGAGGLCYDCYAGWFVGVDEATLPTTQKEPAELVNVDQILIKKKYKGITGEGVTRTREEAYKLAKTVLKEARTKDVVWSSLQKTYNEDSVGSIVYIVKPNSLLVRIFKETAFNLGVGQIDICESKFGFHILRRIK